MNLARRYHRAAGLLVVLGITSYTTAAEAPMFALVGVPIVLVAWRLTRDPDRRPHLPRWVVNTLLVGAILYAAWRGATRGADVDGVAELVLLLQLVKLGDRRTPRDDAQVLTLAVFLAIAAVLTSPRLWVGVQLLVFIPTLIWTVMLHQLQSGWHAASAAAGAAGVAPPDDERTASFPVHLRATAVLSLVASLGAAVAIFILMPRGIGGDFFGHWTGQQGRAVTGFADQVRLGAGGVISSSSEVVLEARGRTIDGVPLGGAGAIHYLRGAVLDRYDRGLWRGAGGAISLEFDDESDVQRVRFGEDPAAADSEWVMTLRGVDRGGQTLFLPWRPIGIEVHGRARVSVTNRAARTMRVYPPGDRAGLPMLDYTVRCASRDPGGTGATRTPGVFFPNRRIATLARQVVEGGGEDPDPSTRPVDSDGAAARVIQDWLRMNYGYTLVERAAPAGVDPIESFLFDTREGHCEYFAAAMTAMCRAVGINARMAVGYVAAEYNPASAAYTVRASNAHAWVEAELGVGRWHRYDPTPTAELVRLHRPALGVWGRVRQWLDAVEFLWNASVVSFDEDARSRLLGGAGPAGGVVGGVERFLQRLRAGGPKLVRSAAMTGGVVFIASAGLGVIVVALLRWKGSARPGAAIAAWWRHARFGRRRTGRADATAAQLRFYRRLLRVLERRGVPKPAWRPPLDHAVTLASADPDSAATVDDVARAYYAARFGGRTLSDAQVAAIDARLAELAARRG